jgi:hypothetical protein
MKIKKIALTSLFVSIGIVLPQAIHIFGGPLLGKILLPMHIPVIIGAMLLGIYSGVLIAILSLGIGVLLGMPPLVIAIYMVFELSVYAIVSSYLNKHKKYNIYFSLLSAKILGLLTALLVTTFMLHILGLGNPLEFGTLGLFSQGIPGIILQIAIIPPIIKLLEKEVNVDD